MASAPSTPHGEPRRGRVARFVACRRCAVGWGLYLVVAAAIVALYAAG